MFFEDVYMQGSLTSRGHIQKLAMRMKKGDERAADGLYRALVRQTYGFYFSRIRNASKAEDLTQEAFMKLVRSIPQYDESKGDFVVWYWRMVRNMLIDHYRTSKDAVTHDIDEVADQAQFAGSEDIEEQIDADAKKMLLARCVGALAPDERELFELRFVSELSYSEISKLIGKNEGALRVGVNRMKKKLEKLLHDHVA